jgi:segregation and condensation protein A
MNMDYSVKAGEFQGPLDKLLALIEEKKLSISEISLAEVTEDFLKYLKTLPRVDFPLLADFVAVASRLILIKSKSLLPSLELTEEEESDIKDLEKRLSVYKELKSARKYLEARWKQGNMIFSREYLAGSEPRVFSPGKNLNPQILRSALEKLFQSLQKFSLETETIKEKIISLEEKIADIIGRITKIGETTLRKLSGASKMEAIATFLALLHLARDQMVRLEQSEHFSDIFVTKNG